MNKQYADFGSISSGTHRSEDLIQAFSSELEYLAKRAGNLDTHAALIKECDAWMEAGGDARDDEVGFELVDALFDALDSYAPPYAYFGSNEGDGADFGFWLHPSALEDFDGLRVNDTSEVPDDYVGEVLHVNDHGNVTLYYRDQPGADLIEVWAIV